MKRLFLLIIVFGCIGTANAQWHFTITSMSYNDVCGGNAIPTYGELGVRILKQLAIQSASKTYSSKEECEIHKSIATMNSSNGGCYIRTTTSPCTGGIISGASGPADILAPSQGYSFYSTNPANEVRNWSSDDIERHLALNQQYQTNSSEAINTNDAKFNEERAEARENNTWYVDPDKPFVSVNLREGGTSTIMSEDYSMINTEWQFLKESQNIAEQSIDEYKDRVFSEAEEMLTDILETANMTQEQLRTTINNWNFILGNFYLTIDRNYKQGRENLEKALLLAKFKVDYKAILNEKYTSSVGESDAEAAIIENSYTQIYGKTRKEWYKEQIENLKKDLIEKGVSESDIELVISKVNEESVNNDRSSVAKNKAEENVLISPENAKNEFFNSVLSGIGEGVPLGVMINNLITIKSYEAIANATEKQLNDFEKEFEKNQTYYQDQKNRIQAIDEVLCSSTSYDIYAKDRKVDYHELKQISHLDFILQKMKNQKRNDSNGYFPKIHENDNKVKISIF